MNKRLFTLCLLLLAMMLPSMKSFAQADNEACTGLFNPLSFMGWTGKTGIRSTGVSTGSNIYNTSVNSSTSLNFTQLAAGSVSTGSGSGCVGSAPAPDNNHKRFQIITSTGNDYYTGGAVSRVPSGYASCFRLGDMWSGSGESAEAMFYEMEITPENALFFIDYAIIAESPSHGSSGNPEFIMRICQPNYNSDGMIVSWQNSPMADNLYYIVQSPDNTAITLPAGWARYNVTTSCKFAYKNWARAAVSFGENMWYRKIRLEVYNSDCNAQYHGAYAYFAGYCQSMLLKVNGCASGSSDSVATITAPKGLSNYAWYRNNNANCTGPNSTDTNYVPVLNAQGQHIQGPGDSVLWAMADHFICNNGDTLASNMFKCVMTSYMDPAKPIYSTVYAELKNLKPQLIVDSSKTCGGEFTLWDLSRPPYVERDSDNVDTSRTVWTFYNANNPYLCNPATQLFADTGYSATYQFPHAGTYFVKVRTSAIDTTCWNEKFVRIRALENPVPQIELEDDSICNGTAIDIRDITPNSTGRSWGFENADTSFWMNNAPQMVNQTFDKTTQVSIHVKNGLYYMEDADGDGTLDRFECTADTTVQVYVGNPPELQVEGDTIVCIGTDAVVNVHTDMAGCSYRWYRALGVEASFTGTTGQEFRERPTDTTKYYVKVTSPIGCEAWDSLTIYTVDPHLKAPVVEMCADEFVELYASNAFSYTWTANPYDPSLEGQENNDTIKVSPRQTTVYTLTGHGMNNCDATPLTKQITVYPFPIPAVEFSPDFIDSEDPTVLFKDVSEGSTSAKWLFEGDFDTVSGKQVRYNFTDMTKDSIMITMICSNKLGCSSDTSFWLPVSLFAVWIPNVFTPQMDNQNQIFNIVTNNELENYSLHIYDRRGDLIFSTFNQMQGWDGTCKGVLCPQAAYVYVVTYKRPGTENIITRKGTVTLLR